jgi:hypothetical protein
LFHHFHHRWISAISDKLNMGSLPDGFYALAEQTISGPIPDVLTLQERPHWSHAEDGGGGLAVAAAPPQAWYTAQAEPERYAAKANRIVIRHPLGKVVAVIEIVSPGNKGSVNALRAFVEKSVGFLDQGIHLLVVDLFPPSKRDPQGIHKAIWDEIQEEPFELPPGKPLTAAAYCAGPTKTAYVEPLAVGDALPALPIFLTAETYIPAPLEATYATTWSTCPRPLKEVVEGGG